jgi:hypothetical protein
METNLFEKKLIKSLKKESMLIPEEYFVSYVISAHLGVVKEWLDRDMNKTPKEMALILYKMSMNGPLHEAGLRYTTNKSLTSF